MDRSQIKNNWHEFVEKGVINASVQPAIADSWVKCKEFGVDPYTGKGMQLSAEIFENVLKANKTLLDLALPLMQTVFKLVESSHFLMVLTDGSGCILETIGDQAIAEMAKDLRFGKGSLWGAFHVGTNAISVALDYDTEIQMVAEEHYCANHHAWTCSAAPIHGLNGEIIGVLNISGSEQDVHLHTLGLIRAAAFSIEQQFFSLHIERLMRTALDECNESILLLDEQFHIVWTNRTARRTLDIDPEFLLGADFRQLMPGIEWDHIAQWDQNARYEFNHVELCVGEKSQSCIVIITSTLIGINERAYNVRIARLENNPGSVEPIVSEHAHYTFSDLLERNPSLKKTIEVAERFSCYEGNVFIEGEVGTGKASFAQAIHNKSARADGPFVAVNCISQPRDLYGGELLGYEKGFGVGALEEGCPGKFELADGGTIYLSEIGDLPLEYQTELMKIIETRTVRRIGSTQEKHLDIRVIAATSHNLRNAIETGRFRRDLFFCINVLSLFISPLRERPEDILCHAEYFLDCFNKRYPHQKKSMSPGFKTALKNHSWPGNIRELQNLIERAFYAVQGRVIEEKEFVSFIRVSGYDDLPMNPFMLPANSLQSKHDKDEYDEIISALDATRYDVGRAARDLGMSRATLYRRIRQYKINTKANRKNLGATTEW